MFVGVVDGTGPFGDMNYQIEMKNSFCKQIADQCKHLNIPCAYLRGPSPDGLSVKRKAAEVCDWIQEAHVKNGKDRFFLVGYSRGASIVILAAESLKKKNIEIEAMFLFDPVARHLVPGGEVVPENVKKVYIARRTQDPDFTKKYEPKIGDKGYIEFEALRTNPTRPYFGITATKPTSGTDVKYQEFKALGSHGAIGGVGWRQVEEDSAAAANVANWMNRQFKEHDLHIKLKSKEGSTARDAALNNIRQILKHPLDSTAELARNTADVIRNTPEMAMYSTEYLLKHPEEVKRITKQQMSDLTAYMNNHPELRQFFIDVLIYKLW